MKVTFFQVKLLQAGKHVEELSFEQAKNNNVLVVGPKRFKNKFRANYHSLDNLGYRFSPFKSSKLEIFLNYIPDVVNTHGTKPAMLLKNLKIEILNG